MYVEKNKCNDNGSDCNYLSDCGQIMTCKDDVLQVRQMSKQSRGVNEQIGCWQRRHRGTLTRIQRNAVSVCLKLV